MNVQGLIGWNVARLRQRMRLSQEQVAQGTGIVDQSYISGLENGKRNPTAVVLVNIAQALGVQVGELFSIHGAPANLMVAPTASKLSGRQKKSGSSLA
jgi:transcriptional regulator with XRE-family HTH domain